MKKTLTLFVALLLSMVPGFSQNCLPNGITITSPLDMNRFPQDYPGCTNIQGTVIIERAGNFRITDLNGLNQITSIQGDLIIRDNTALTSLSGLSNLASIGGHLTIFDNSNSALTNLSGLGSLAAVGGDVTIEECDELLNLQGLEGLTNIGGNLTIKDNQELITLQGIQNIQNVQSIEIDRNRSLTNADQLSNFTSIPGDFLITINNDLSFVGSSPWNLRTVGGNLEVSDILEGDELNILSNLRRVGGDLYLGRINKSSSLSGLNRLDSIYGEFTLRWSDDLERFAGFSQNIYIGGDIFIYSNPRLKSINGLEGLTKVYGDFRVIGDSVSDFSGLRNLKVITKSCSLTVAATTGFRSLDTIKENFFINTKQKDYSGFENLKYVGERFVVTQHNTLENFQGLDNLNYIGNFIINNCQALQSFEGLENLITIRENLDVRASPLLTEAKGLTRLDSIGGDFQINNNNFVSFIGLDNIRVIHGVLYIAEHSNILNLDGLESLEAVGSLSIFENPRLQNLNGLSGLKTMTEQFRGLYIYQNPELTSIRGLNNLATISGGNLQISHNAKLPSLQGIGNIDYQTIGTILVRSSPSLTVCNTKSICDHIAFDRTNTTITSNATGCDRIGQVELRCGTFVSIDPQEELEAKLSISPNPVTNSCTISWKNDFPIATTFQIRDAMGKQVAGGMFTDSYKLNTATLPAGIYHCTLFVHDQYITKSFLKK